jgi:acyl-coenzyme A synthetase/AMP-(fatty) acid ligase
LGAIAAGRPALLIDFRQPDLVHSATLARAAVVATVGRHAEGIPHFTLEQLVEGPGSDEEWSPRPFDASSISTILMTSGTTGRPKLVLRSRLSDLHGALALRVADFDIRPGDRFWLPAPYAGSPFPGVVMAVLLARATLVVERFQASGAGDFLKESKITGAYLGPTMIRLASRHDGLLGPGWKQLTAILSGGEKLDDQTAQLMLDRFPDQLYVGYGCTEVTRITEATSDDLRKRPGTVGRPLPLRQVRIAEMGTQSSVPVGVEGEIFVRGADMYQGYLGEVPAGRWHRTGDLGYLDEDGYLFLTGRASSLVQVGGNRVSTEEVVAVLRGHPGIADAAVLAFDDQTWTTRLEAFVVPREANALVSNDLDKWLRQRLSSYKIPRVIHFLESMPVDRASGKLSTQALRDLAEGQKSTSGPSD